MQSLQAKLQSVGYIAESALATTLSLFIALQRPLLLEGEAGVGKTEIAKVLAQAEETDFIRLQCYEGLDAQSALYEWNYQQQLLAIQLAGHQQKALSDADLFSEQYLLRRPLLNAITQENSPVLLIDEIDRADEAFEAFLLEVLSDYQVSIPELGTIKAKSIPRVILTSNGTRELSDALRRRCLYFYVDYPAFDKELQIVRAKYPSIDQALASQIVRFVQQIRQMDLRKTPGIAETLDWTAGLLKLGIDKIDRSPEDVLASLICLLKTREDLEAINATEVERLAARAL